MAKGIIKDLVIVGVGILVIVIGLQIAFGGNPFYVVASGSMIPALQVYDVLIVQGHEPFEDIEIGDIIVFDRPSDHNRVIVHRVVSILNDEPKTIRTQGDANPASIPGTDFPITEEEYIGKVVYTIPQVGYIPKLLTIDVLGIPLNYIIIAIVIGAIIAKSQISKKKKEEELPFSDPFDSDNPDTIEKPSDKPDDGELSDIDKMQKDSEYSEHLEESKNVEEYANATEEKKTDEKTSDKKDKKE